MTSSQRRKSTHDTFDSEAPSWSLKREHVFHIFKALLVFVCLLVIILSVHFQLERKEALKREEEAARQYVRKHAIQAMMTSQERPWGALDTTCGGLLSSFIEDSTTAMWQDDEVVKKEMKTRADNYATLYLKMECRIGPMLAVLYAEKS